VPSDLGPQAARQAAALAGEIGRHLADGGRGERLREGLTIAIIGAPNAGKSSLLNALVGREAAIVSPQPGTTRDVIECRLDLGGVPAVLADTAGLRTTEEAIEREGVRRAHAKAEEADLLVAVFAADAVPDAETLRLVAARPDAILVASKCDLAPPPRLADVPSLLETSVRTEAGLDSLKAALAGAAARMAGLTEAPLLTRARHRRALTSAVEGLQEGAAAPLPELAAEAYRGALLALGQVTGRIGVEAVLDLVFADFCIGK